MKFLVDECMGPTVAAWVKNLGYDTTSVFEGLRGTQDEDLLSKAYRESRIIITSDKDYGDMVFRQQMDHCGIILLRLADERSLNKIEVLKKIFANYHAQIPGNFIVATEKGVKVTLLMH